MTSSDLHSSKFRSSITDGVLPTRVEEENGTRVAFQAFLLFAVVIFIAPQSFVPILGAIGIGKIAMLVALLTYVKYALSQGRLNIVKGSELRVLGILVCLGLASVAFSRWPGGSLQFFQDFFLKSALVFFLAANLLTSEKRFRTLCWSFAAFGAFNAVNGFRNYLNGVFMGFDRIQGGLAPLAENPNDLALFLGLCLPLIWYAYRTTSRKFAKLALLGAAGLCLFTVFLTLSRGGFLTLIAMAGMFLWNRARKNFLPVLLGCALVIPLLIVLLPEGYGTRITSIFDSSLDESGSRDARIRMMESGLQQMLTNPIGVGLGMNILASVDFGDGWVPIHNAYLQVGVELGVLGLILYLLLLRMTSQGLKRIQDHPDVRLADLALAIRLVLVGYAVGAFFAPVAYNFYFFYPGGMAVALKHLANVKTEKTDRSLCRERSETYLSSPPLARKVQRSVKSKEMI